jgi:signal transduction histidine kinase
VLSRLPIRLRLTLAFAGVLAVLFSALGVVLYLRFESALDAGIDQALASRAGELAAAVAAPGRGIPLAAGPQPGTARGAGFGRLLGRAGRVLHGTPLAADREPAAERGASFAQLLDREGRVVDSSPGLPPASLLRPPELAEARRRTVLITRDEELRLLAQPARTPAGPRVLIVGASLAQRERALESMGTVLLAGGPLALLIAAVAGYGVASAALRPVEAMRRRAATISAGDAHARLPLPAARDEVFRLGDTINGTLERLEQALDQERRLVADASHELRTPLAILKAELELAAEPATSEAELRAAVASAREETDRLARLADDLLLVAGADRGELPVHPQPVALPELLHRVVARFAAHPLAAGRPVTVDVPEGLAVVADPLRLEQAVGNLLDNALRHGEGPIAVTARAGAGAGTGPLGAPGARPDAAAAPPAGPLRAGDAVALEVADRGAGFPPAFLPRAFDRFARADQARGRGGTGLGLAIVGAIARAHGGEVHADNLPGGGARVRLTLPRAPAGAPRALDRALPG